MTIKKKTTKPAAKPAVKKPTAKKAVAKKPVAAKKPVVKPIAAKKSIAKPAPKKPATIKPVQIAETQSVETEFTPDAFVIRTSDKDGKSYGDFQWKQEVGAIVEAPDWKSEPICGFGLHGCLDGVGDWSLLSDRADALWWIIGVKRSECVDLEGKVKFPRGKVVYFGRHQGAMQLIAREWRRIAETSAESMAKGKEEHASAAGDSGHASAAGNYGHASAAGYRGHASAAGYRGIAVALGYSGKARASETGAICVAHIDTLGKIVAIRASKVGENGIKPNTWYSLTASCDFQEVDGE